MKSAIIALVLAPLAWADLYTHVEGYGYGTEILGCGPVTGTARAECHTTWMDPLWPPGTFTGWLEASASEGSLSVAGGTSTSGMFGGYAIAQDTETFRMPSNMTGVVQFHWYHQPPEGNTISWFLLNIDRPSIPCTDFLIFPLGDPCIAARFTPGMPLRVTARLEGDWDMSVGHGRDGTSSAWFEGYVLNAHVIPEPSTWMLLAITLAGLGGRRLLTTTNPLGFVLRLRFGKRLPLHIRGSVDSAAS